MNGRDGPLQANGMDIPESSCERLLGDAVCADGQPNAKLADGRFQEATKRIKQAARMPMGAEKRANVAAAVATAAAMQGLELQSPTQEVGKDYDRALRWVYTGKQRQPWLSIGIVESLIAQGHRLNRAWLTQC